MVTLTWHVSKYKVHKLDHSTLSFRFLLLLSLLYYLHLARYHYHIFIKCVHTVLTVTVHTA